MPGDSVTPGKKKPRVVVAGQIPPPTGGQNIMIERTLLKLQADPTLDAHHLPFYFTTDFQSVRSAGLGKLLELVRVIGRLLRLRLTAPIDCLIYPSGGPQTVPIIRDILLLPWILLLSRHTVIQFHAAGIADRLAASSSLSTTILSWLYRQAEAAMVMTEFNRRDPEALEMTGIHVIPHLLADESLPRTASDADPERILLYVGHLCPDKGTPDLLRAFAGLHREYSEIRLHLVGECLPPFSATKLKTMIADLGLGEKVVLRGVLAGREKWAAYAAAHLFVFPSVAPYESFGLVLAEAMMAGLPIVTSRWRGNLDVVGTPFGGVFYDPKPEHAQALKATLREALEQASQWNFWGTENKRRYESTYSLEKRSDLYGKTILGILGRGQ